MPVSYVQLFCVYRNRQPYWENGEDGGSTKGRYSAKVSFICL